MTIDLISGDDAKDVGLGNDQHFLAVDLHFGAAVLGDENLVAHLHGELDGFAIFILAAGAEAEDLRFLGLFLGGVREHDAAGADCFGVESLHEHALTEWFDAGHVVGWFGLRWFVENPRRLGTTRKAV
jgi:hypothetical protein